MTQDNETPKTDAAHFRLHASFINWPDEAQDAIERYDELARELERDLRAAQDRIDRLMDVLRRLDAGCPYVVCDDEHHLKPCDCVGEAARALLSGERRE